MSLWKKVLTASSSVALGAVLAGCATGHPGADALGNFVGAMFIANEGAPQQTVTVNQPVLYVIDEWRVFLAGSYEDLNRDGEPARGELRNIKDVFTFGEPQLFLADNPARHIREFSYDIFNAQGVRIHTGGAVLRQPLSSVYFIVKNVPLGEYRTSFFGDKQFLGSVSFSVRQPLH